MRRMKLIGIGAGDPEFLTLQAIEALGEVDVVFLTDKGSDAADLLRAREVICERYAKDCRRVSIEDPARARGAADYGAAVLAWHEERARVYESSIERHLADGQCGAFLVWGDPSLYDSALRIMETMTARRRVEFEYEIIPGISSIQVLAARHKISLHDIGEPVKITTGRLLSDADFDSAASVVVMLDGRCAFGNLARHDLDIYWGAYLGTPDEILIAGPLAQVAQRIRETRARAREEKGWIMDTYLLRRRVE
jgi:precorrin-6A synthase